jgi:SAM-dependent methyltransferase
MRRGARSLFVWLRGSQVGRALDVGSGDGEVSAELGRLTGADVVCGDISDVAVRACRDRGLEAHKIELGTVPLPFPDDSFDLVFMTEVLEHLVRPDEAIADVRRVLKPGSRLLLSTPNLACLPNRFLLPLGIQPLFTEVSEIAVFGRVLRAFGEGGQPVGHLRLFTKGALLQFLRAHGLDVEVVRGAAFHSSGLFSHREGDRRFAGTSHGAGSHGPDESALTTPGKPHFNPAVLAFSVSREMPGVIAA